MNELLLNNNEMKVLQALLRALEGNQGVKVRDDVRAVLADANVELDGGAGVAETMMRLQERVEAASVLI